MHVMYCFGKSFLFSRICLVVLLFFCCECLWLSRVSAQGAAGEADGIVDFSEQVRPLLRRHCERCHGEKNQEGDLRLSNRDDALGEADSGIPVIVPGHAAKSLLISRIMDESAGDLMPLDGEPLTQQEVDLLRRWINQGADWPASSSDRKHWAYQPIKRPDVPAHLATDQVIDHFLDQKLAARGLVANGSMQPASVARRASLGLIGLPPTPDEIRRFVERSHVSPREAYSELLDRLLASPRYGERWAVPWLDLARYADSNGFQADQMDTKMDLGSTHDTIIEPVAIADTSEKTGETSVEVRQAIAGEPAEMRETESTADDKEEGVGNQDKTYNRLDKTHKRLPGHLRPKGPVDSVDAAHQALKRLFG